MSAMIVIKVYEPKRYETPAQTIKEADRKVQRMIAEYKRQNLPYRIAICTDGARVTFRSEEED